MTERTDADDRKTGQSPEMLPESLYGDAPNGLKAHCIYFYYLKETPDLKEKTRAFFLEYDHALNRDALEKEIPKLIEKANNGAIRPVGWKLGDIRWRRKSWFVVVLDDDHHKLKPGDAVSFEFKSSTGQSPAGPNHNFRYGKDIPISRTITGFVCYNQMKGSHGRPLDDESEVFFVKVNHGGHGDGQGGGKGAIERRFTHDDSGTNTGPPLQP
jgi:hypothetical protein